MSSPSSTNPTPNKAPSAPPVSRKGFRSCYVKPKPADGIPELSNCVFHCGARAMTDYQDNLKRLAKYVGSTFKLGGDLRASILKGSIMGSARPTDPAASASTIEEEIWRIEITEYIKTKNKLAAQLKKVYALIWGQCSDYMRARVKTMPLYLTFSGDQDPLELLGSIKSLTYEYDVKENPIKALRKNESKLIRFYQGRDMSLTVYFERFKNLVLVMDQHKANIGNHDALIQKELADITGEPYNENTDYTMAQYKTAKATVKERYLAVMFLASSDKNRYEEILISLHNDFIQGNDRYPTSLTQAYTLLMESKTSKSNTNRSIEEGASFAQGGTPPSCWGCGKPRTVLSECKEPECVKKWANRQQQRTEHSGTQHLMFTPQDLTGGDAVLEQSYSFHQSTGMFNKVPPHLILLDSRSTHDTFYSEDLLQNIRPTDITLTMNTNAGELKFDLEGDLPGHGPVFFNPEGIANVLSMARVEERGTRITYDTNKGSCFRLHDQHGGYKEFHKIGYGLYLCDTTLTPFHHSQDGLSLLMKTIDGASFVTTVKENKRMFTSAELQQAKAARELFKMIGSPSYRDFLALVEHNMIPNAKVGSKDIQNAESIYGPDLGVIQGKTVRDTPKRLQENIVAVPANILLKYQQVILYADIMFVAGMPFLVTLSQHIRFYTAARLKNRDAKVIGDALIKVIRLYSKRGFHIHVIHMDGEFNSVTHSVEKAYPHVTMNMSGPNDHIPQIERAIRTVKERVRSLILTLPFKRLPLTLIVHAVIFSVQWLNFFPPKHSISPRLSPEAIIRGRSVDAKLHCRIPFGGYAQVHKGNEPINDVLTSRTVGGISLGPTGNMQGTYKFLSTLTSKLIKGTQFTPLPMPQEVIQIVNNMFQTNVSKLVIANRRNVPDPTEYVIDDYSSNDDSTYVSANKEIPEDEDLIVDHPILPHEIPIPVEGDSI